MDFEYLYILENENIPKLVKFGFTKNHPRERAKQLSADTGVPGRYKIIKFWRVTDGFKWEQYVFKRLSSYRKTGEFLKLTPQSAIDKIEIILTESEATSDYEKFELKESRRREKELFEEEHLKKRQEEWDKNLYKVERQATSEAEKRLGFTYFSIETQIDEINKKSIAVKTQETFNFVWFGFNMLFFFLPMIGLGILKWIFEIKNTNESWLRDSMDGGKSSKEISQLYDKKYKLNDERDSLVKLKKKNFFTLPQNNSEIKDSKKNGQGTYTYANGDKYVGEYKDGKKNGQGTYYYSNGEKFIGGWKNNQRNGQGTYIHANGEKYVGKFKDGKQHGQGTYTYANGDKYVGEWKNGLKDGQSTFTWMIGDKYVGEFKDGKQHGQGTHTYLNGNKYLGEWKNGLKNGQGTFSYPNGKKYIGEWNNNNPTQGIFTYANGDKYEGEFKDGKKHGQGVYTYPSGDKYVGEWKNGEMHGEGTYSHANGYKEEMIFKDGVDVSD